MSNGEYFNKIKPYYPSLSFFTVRNNFLILQMDNTMELPLMHVNLSHINPNLFYLEPQEIFNVIFMLELLYKPNLTSNQVSFIENYMQYYLSLNDKFLGGEEGLSLKVFGLSMPIYNSYDEIVQHNPAANIIKKIINSHVIDNESGKNKQPRLVRTNKTMEAFITEEDNMTEFKKAGFATLILIGSTIAATVSYIMYYILGH